MTPSKKYTLFASSADGSRPPCAFFLSSTGCRNGDQCKFAHTKPASMFEEQVVSAEGPGSVVSSESSGLKDENQSLFVKNPEGELVGEKSKKRKRRGKRAAEASPFANPSNKAKVSLPTPSKQNPEASNSKPKVSEQKKKSAQKEADVDFRSLDLPIAPFRMPGTLSIAPEPKEAADPPSPTASLPLPTSTTFGQKWLAAVKKTREHPRFNESFDFVKFKAQDAQVGHGPKSWIKAKPFGSWSENLPQVVAIDCEMCMTQDPVSGERDPRALCRISIVDAVTGEALLDSLVKPAWPVVDYRTWINGIEEGHLENVQFTLRHAQAFMLALCSEETVIVGHAIHNDLAAIRMEHYCVVDSACLFSVSNSPTSTIGLRDLAAGVLEKAMPEKHDSVNDARTALACLEHYVEKGGKVDAVERVVRLKPNLDSQLFVHRIPKHCDEGHLSQMFLSHTSVKPVEVDKIEFTGDNGKTIAHFHSFRHASLAFDSLESKAEVEASGRLQKKVYLRTGGYIRVRKMAFEKDKRSATTVSLPEAT